MAELIFSFATATALERIASTLIKTSTPLSEVESQIESIERELEQIHAFLGHVERKEEEGQGEDINEWAEAKALAQEGEDILETFMIKSVKRKRRRRSIFLWIEQHKVDKELKSIRKQLADITYRRKNYMRRNTGHAVGTSSEVNVALPAAVTLAQAIEKCREILDQNRLASHKVIKIVEQVRHEFVTMHNILTNLESTVESSERHKILEEQVKDVCHFTDGVVRDFTVERCISEKKFGKKMKFIKTQMQGAYDRRWAYGIGEYYDEWEGIRSMVPRKSLKRRILTRGLLVSLWVCYFMFTPGPPDLLTLYIAVFSLALVVAVQVVTLWRSVDRNLELVRSNLSLMHALSKDVECTEDLNERQKAWMEQVRVLAQRAEGLLAAYEHKRQRVRRRGSFSRHILYVPHRLRLAKDISNILYKIGDISKRKKYYGITTVEGRKFPDLLNQNVQRNEINSVPHSAENDKEGQPAALQVMNRYRPFKGFQEKIESLQGHLQLMNALFKDVEQMEELDGKARAWVEQMRGIAREAESFIDACDNRADHGHIRICHYFTRNRELKRIRKKIEGALRGKKAYSIEQQTHPGLLSIAQRLRQWTHPSLIVKESNIIGFDDDVEVLMSQLTLEEEHLCVTSIVGIRGIGKTTLASSIFDSNAVKDHFYPRIWVPVPQNYIFESLLEDIVKQTTEVPDVKWRAKEDLIHILETSLANKRYLIVVDDVPTSEVWDSLKKAIPDTCTGSRVLLISRNIYMASHIIGPRSFLHQLQLLDDEHSWELFSRSMKVGIPHELREIGKNIVIKCGGLPSEIVKMGHLLSNKDVTEEEWLRVLGQINQETKPWLETHDNIHMNLRRCLLYFVLFPADFKIPARRLIVLWVAEGLIHHRDQNKESPEHAAERYLTQLIDRNMVQVTKRKDNGKVKTCRLPNALREIWLKKAEESKFLYGHRGTTTSSIRRLADHLDRNDVCYTDIHGNKNSSSASLRACYKDVLSFLSFDAQEGSQPGEDIGNFLNRCISSDCFLLLRVLDLERVYKPKLPKIIGKLWRLSYLGLRWTYLESLPSSISKLLRLQTLDLKHTYISTLPCSIWEMELRHLYLSEIFRSRFPPRPRGGLGSLTDLQTLWGLFVDEKCPVKDGLDRLLYLKKLGLACQSMSSQPQAMESQLKAIADWLLRLKDLQSLRLKSRDEQGRPWNLQLKSLSDHKRLTDMCLLGKLSHDWSTGSLFPPSLVELTLSHSRLSEDPMQILKDLVNLRSLHLYSEAYKGKNMLCKSGNFPQLRVLKIWKLEELEEWDIEGGALSSLRQLEIRSCGHLNMLPSGLQHVKTLLELKLTDMPMQFNMSIRDSNSEDWHKIQHIPNVCYE